MRGRLGLGVLLLASFALTCGAAELGFRAAGFQPIYDVYSRPELFWQHDPQLGWSLEPGARGRFVGPRPFPIEFDTAIEINSLGLRGPEPGRRQIGEPLVLVLGDSVVAGFEVEHSQSFVTLLERVLEERMEESVSVVNAGVRGYGTDQSLLWYRERGRSLAPDLVVLVFSANDFDDNLTLHRARRPFGKGAFALRSTGGLELVGVPVPRYPLCSSWRLDASYELRRNDGPFSRSACLLQTRLTDRSALFTFVATALGRLPGIVPLLKNLTEPGGEAVAAQASALPWPRGAARGAGVPEGGADAAALEPHAAELTTALLQTFAREVRASGARFLLLMTQRHWEKLDVRALAADQIEPHAVAMPVGLDPSQIRFRNDGHFNALGHRIYADGLAPLVEAALRGERRLR